ncbi:MAG: GspE/PulE family protein [Patescibacteria group bacterium]
MSTLNDKIYFLNRTQEEHHTEERAKAQKLPYINLSGYPLVKEILDLVPEENAFRYKVIPYLKVGKQIKIAAVDPKNQETINFLSEWGDKLGVQFQPGVMSESSWRYGLYEYEKAKTELSQKKAELEEHQNKVQITDIKSAADAAKKASTTELLEILLYGAMQLNASDIHIEPAEDGFLTRYRVDGVLQDVVFLPIPAYKQLIARIKYMSKLRMDITDKPQDGRFSFKDSREEIDFRVSIMPSAFGESVVLRLLGQEKSILSLDKLGFRPDALAIIREAISKPHGMILTSGPTGSGKSSTLYAILMDLKKPGVKIITLEDPVEYKIDGIEQSQVKPGAGYEFADGLRASLRQDPDVLMVGEIRDISTAEIAVQAALTGHLLLSTIHANSAPAVYARFLEMGVQPFLLSGSINLIMAQRLVRKVCPDCQEEITPRPEVWQVVLDTLRPIKDRLPAEANAKISSGQIKLKKGAGCKSCNNTGFSGRQVVIEVLIPNEQIEQLISKKASIFEFEKAAQALGMITMEQDGLIKAILGTTTIEEVWRVTKS